jgi:hypothetical protein
MMPRNRIQFQKGLSEPRFRDFYGTAEQCRAALFRWRWPDGFSCPRCGAGRHCEIASRGLYQCAACRHQVSPTAGTLFHATKLPLSLWFLAIYHMTQSKKGISSIELARRLGVTQTTAWKIKQKLMQAMLERDAAFPLAGRVEMDDAYLGGRRSGGKRGRGAPAKTPFVAAVETTPEGRPLRIKLRRVKGFRKTEIRKMARRDLSPRATVISDGLSCFTAVTDHGCAHYPTPTGSGPQAVQITAFKWVNTTIGNLKNGLRGTYHAIRPKHVPRYLAAFQYRYNRRYRLEDMIEALARDALRTPPMPYRLLKLAEVGA